MKKEHKKILIPLLLGILLIALSVTFATVYTSRKTKENITTPNLYIKIVQNGTLTDSNTLDIDTSKLSVPGQTYNIPVNVANTGDVPLYLRVIINRRFTKTVTVEKDQQEKEVNRQASGTDPTLIELDQSQLNDMWYVDSESDEKNEQIICYYKIPLQPKTSTSGYEYDGETDPSTATNVLNAVTLSQNITGEYGGDCAEVSIKAEAVQTTKAQDAILAEWGVNANFNDDGSLAGLPTAQ